MPGRYEDDLPGDAVMQVDGDGFFVGLDSRSQPENLSPGIVAVAQNMRFNERKAVVRGGIEKQTNDISFTGQPLILPFSLLDSPVLQNAYGGALYESCVWSDDMTNAEYVAMAGPQSAFLFRPGVPVVEIDYPAGQTIISTDQVDMFQVGGSLYILRGQDTTVGISNLSRVGTTATLNSSAAHEQHTGRTVTIAGAYPAWYNGTFTITVTGSSSFTYTTGAATNLADSLLETAVVGTHFTNRSQAVAAGTYTYSVYAKPNGRDWIQLAFSFSDGGFANVFFNINAGTVGTTSIGVGPSLRPINLSGSIVNAGGGWFRCSATCTSAALTMFNAVLLSTNGATTAYMGDITKGVFLFGAQLQTGTSATAYEPTTTTASANNLFTYSEDFTNAVWLKTRATVTGDTTEEPATGNYTLTLSKTPLRWDGDVTQTFVEVTQGTITTPYIYMPSSDFGLIMQNRAVLQYKRNQAIVSEVLAVERYNSIFGVFTFREGEADFLIGFHPYQENECLIFNRRSVYIIDDIDGGVELMPQRELTRQIGCVSRRSIATCGQLVLFLSDNGVYVLQPGLELQLRGNNEPLSGPVDDIIQRVNTAAVQKAYGIYFNNRYYLSMPVDGSTRNNAMIVYNFLNAQWESVDTFPNGFFCDYMEVINDGEKDGLYLISGEGGIYQHEVGEVDQFGSADSPPANFLIPGRLVTRMVIFGDTDLKRFSRMSANINLHASGGMTITALTTNPENTKQVLTRSTVAEEDFTFRGLIGMRAYGAQIEFENTATRMEITNFRVQAYTQDRKTISTS